jgi:hypothetical protein
LKFLAVTPFGTHPIIGSTVFGILERLIRLTKFLETGVCVGMLACLLSQDDIYEPAYETRA